MLTSTVKIVENNALGGYTVIETWNAEPLVTFKEYPMAVEWVTQYLLSNAMHHANSMENMEGFSKEGLDAMYDFAWSLNWDCGELSQEYTRIFGA